MDTRNDSINIQYHNTTSAYALPNDNPEHDRLEYQAEAYEKLMHNNVFHAPVSQPKRILDIGCGTGRTTIQLAQKYPDAQVIGIDLSPVPPVHVKPDNVEYIQGDFLELAKSESKDVRFRAGTFDYIFSRLLVLGMTDWPGYFSAVTRLLALGGWLEAHEYYSAVFGADGNLLSSDWPSLNALWDLVERKGLDPRAAPNLSGRMKDYELCNVQETIYRQPYVEDPGAPETQMIQKITARHPTSLHFIWQRLGKDVYSPEQLESYADGYVNACANLKLGDHSRMYVVIGRKDAG